MARTSKHAHSDNFDGNAIGLTEAFNPVGEDGFTMRMSPLPISDEGDGGDDEDDTPNLDMASESHGELTEDDAVPQVGVITETTGTLPASKSAEKSHQGARHAKHAAEVQGSSRHVPEYMRKSKRMRRILIVIIILLVVLLAGMIYFGIMMYQQSGSAAVKQVANSEQQVGDIQGDGASDASEAAKLTAVPDLVGLLGLTQDEAVERLQHGAQPSTPRNVNESGNPIKKEVRVALTSEPADSTTGTPTVYLGLNKKGKIIQAGYSVSTASLGYGALSFADAVRNEKIIQKTLAEAGISVPEDAVELPEDPDAYTTFDTDGKTRTKEYCSFSGEVDIDGTAHTWSAVLSYDYSMANASGNLADTVRTIFIYVNV